MTRDRTPVRQATVAAGCADGRPLRDVLAGDRMIGITLTKQNEQDLGAYLNGTYYHFK